MLGRGDPDHPRPVRRRGYINFRGEHFDVESAKLWDLPEKRVPIGVAVSGAAVLRDRRRAGRRDDRRRARSPSSARCSTPPAAPASRGSGRCRSASAPTRPPRSPGRTRCSAGSACGWKVNAELPGPPAFDAASQFVREEDVAERIPCGDDVDAVLEAAKEYADAGFTHLALVQIGGDQQAPFIEWSEQTLMPAWRDAFGS